MRNTENTGLIDIFGLSGNPADDDRLDDLLLRLESETPSVHQENSKRTVYYPLSAYTSETKLSTISKSQRPS
ncbi:hypothetical protein SAMN05216420_101316 [Nitrosospira sp. Nl5]|uniref:hypothetical protein n=1 Tax=Nitrosospira sp. Nl5 TaxID=200120 RepID=UPI000882A829|nr:hypothetical protein [Nitrosospira sp. Nl5]SCX91340.1 hypothetical protein SAMN05216420_101316 [Nitrosospira sp. Nl5]